MTDLMQSTEGRLPALEQRVDTLLWKIPLWDAINAYVRACGGNPNVIENVAGQLDLTQRQAAVVHVEKVVATARERAIDLYIAGQAKEPCPPDWICASCHTPISCPRCECDDIDLGDGKCNECRLDVSDAWFEEMRKLADQRVTGSQPTAALPAGWAWECQTMGRPPYWGARGPHGAWVDAETIEGVAPTSTDLYNEARAAQAIVRSVTPLEIDRVNPGPVPEPGSRG